MAHTTHAPTRTAARAVAAVVLEDAAAATAHLLGKEQESLAASAGTDLHEARHADANWMWRRGELLEPLLKMLMRHTTDQTVMSNIKVILLSQRITFLFFILLTRV